MKYRFAPKPGNTGPLLRGGVYITVSSTDQHKTLHVTSEHIDAVAANSNQSSHGSCTCVLHEQPLFLNDNSVACFPYTLQSTIRSTRNAIIQTRKRGASLKARAVPSSQASMPFASHHFVILPSNLAYRKCLSADRDLSKDVACATQRNV